MKKLILLSAMLFSSASFAIPTSALIEKCAETGVEKLLIQAEAKNCSNKRSELLVREVDNRILNPSKYVWYGMNFECPEGKQELVEMVQYNSLSRECL